MLTTVRGEYTGRDVQTIVRRVYGQRARAVLSAPASGEYVGSVIRHNRYLDAATAVLDHIIAITIDGTRLDATSRTPAQALGGNMPAYVDGDAWPG